MKYVYVVMAGCVGDEHIVCIKTSQKKANDIVNQMNNDVYEKRTKPWVEKWELT